MTLCIPANKLGLKRHGTLPNILGDLTTGHTSHVPHWFAAGGGDGDCGGHFDVRFLYGKSIARLAESQGLFVRNFRGWFCQGINRSHTGGCLGSYHARVQTASDSIPPHRFPAPVPH